MVKSHNSKILSSQLAKERTHEHFGGQGDKGLHAPTRKTLASRQGLTPDAPAKKRKPSYTAEQVIKWCKQHGLPEPVFEHKFAESIGRKWRFDLAWKKELVAAEIQGGIFIQGRHTRGASLLKEWEKLNAACAFGYRVLFFSPTQLLTDYGAETIKKALSFVR